MVLGNLGLALKRANRLQEAMVAYQKSLDATPDWASEGKAATRNNMRRCQNAMKDGLETGSAKDIRREYRADQEVLVAQNVVVRACAFCQTMGDSTSLKQCSGCKTAW